MTLVLNFRQSVLRHRSAAPILIEHLPREIPVNSFEDAAQFFSESGVPAHLHIQILDGMEMLCIGAVMLEPIRNPRGRRAFFPNIDAAQYPYLAEALAANELTIKDMFAERIASFRTAWLLPTCTDHRLSAKRRPEHWSAPMPGD